MSSAASCAGGESLRVLVTGAASGAGAERSGGRAWGEWFVSSDDELYFEEDVTTKFTMETEIKTIISILSWRLNTMHIVLRSQGTSYDVKGGQIDTWEWGLLPFPFGMKKNQTTVAAKGGDDSGFFGAKNVARIVMLSWRRSLCFDWNRKDRDPMHCKYWNRKNREPMPNANASATVTSNRNNREPMPNANANASAYATSNWDNLEPMPNAIASATSTFCDPRPATVP
jgi:hypothetical protein